MVSAEKLSAIKLVACNIEGVLTDGSVIYCSSNIEMKAFHIRDGLAIKMAVWCKFPVVWLTLRRSDAVDRRAAELNATVYQGVTDKSQGLRKAAREHQVSLEEIAYIGDDLNDLPALQVAGLPIAVAGAVPEVIAASDYVTQTPGGRGALREVIELIFRSQGRWEDGVQTYLEHLREPEGSTQ